MGYRSVSSLCSKGNQRSGYMGRIFFQENLLCQGKILDLRRSKPFKGYATKNRRREWVSSAVRQGIKACATQWRGWSENILFMCEITVANCERPLSQGRESVNLAERGLKDHLGKWEIYGEDSAELGG